MVTQIARPFRVKTDLGEDALLLDSFRGDARVSEPFRYVLRVLSANPSIDMKGLLSKPAVIALSLQEEKERFFHGVINRMSLLETGEDGMAAYEVELVPWIWFLGLFSDCRIFQNKSVPQIVEQVFKDRGFFDYKLDLTGTYPSREYCVQYCETDLNFISRLMEEEGIFYFFAHAESKHVLVLADAKSAFPKSNYKPEAQYQPASGGRLPEDTVATLEYEYALHVGTASLTDYDFEKPLTNLRTTEGGALKGEIYDYPGKYKTKKEGERYARIRQEEQEARLLTARGTSNCMGFECGSTFDLTDHYREDANQGYAILSLQEAGRNTSYRAGDPDPFSYTNRFTVIPASVPFRPERRSRVPRIEGTQTAVVVGPAGEEIFTDKYGRIKVQFHWDREGKHDQNSSCFIRVAQPWAGKQWGAVFLPRIGQEVIVSFLGGDPDQPIITGSVYNADQMPPYPLPGNQTKSVIKSMSSKGGGGFNEIRLDDTKGEEKVFIHGEKDLDLRVKNDRKEWIGRNRHLVVGNDKLEKVVRDEHSEIVRDRIEKVGRDHHVEIVGKAAIKITGSESVKVTGDVIEQYGSNHSSVVSQNLYLKAMQIVIEATAGITLKVGANFVTVDPAGVAIKGTLIQLNSGGAALSGSAGSLVPPLAPTAAADPIKADPGEVTKAQAAQTATPLNMTATSVAPARRSAATDAPTHNPAAAVEDSPEKKHWIEIQLFDEMDQPVPGEPYRITLPDGTTVADGTLDENGWARVDGIDPGMCKVTFPNLDKEAWEKK